MTGIWSCKHRNPETRKYYNLFLLPYSTEIFLDVWLMDTYIGSTWAPKSWNSVQRHLHGHLRLLTGGSSSNNPVVTPVLPSRNQIRPVTWCTSSISVQIPSVYIRKTLCLLFPTFCAFFTEKSKKSKSTIYLEKGIPCTFWVLFILFWKEILEFQFDILWQYLHSHFACMLNINFAISILLCSICCTFWTNLLVEGGLLFWWASQALTSKGDYFFVLFSK
jgi:hypothetical protein